MPRKPPKRVTGDPPLLDLVKRYGPDGVRELAARDALPPRAAAEAASAAQLAHGHRDDATQPENAAKRPRRKRRRS